jgi:DNA repair protein REV1
MAQPTVPQASQSNSSDYFEEEDSQFLEALATAILPGDQPKEHDPENESQELVELPPSQPCLKRRYSHTLSDEEKEDSELNVVENNIYGASRFGGFGEYMRRKRAKLQIQNAELEQPSATDDGEKSQIFKGIAIYVSPLYVKRIS